MQERLRQLKDSVEKAKQEVKHWEEKAKEARQGMV
jgi:hypothetical protein